MNRKGFTLIEVLAVIIIMGIILVIAVPNIMSVYKNSKLKSEEIFVERLSQTIDSYVKLYKDEEITFTEIRWGAEKKEENKSYDVTISQGIISVQSIIDSDLMSPEDYANAGNKDVACNKEAKIDVYRDSDYVYCYKVEKNELGCLTKEYKEKDNSIYAIDTCIWIWKEEQ